jgi:hypothetical protein
MKRRYPAGLLAALSMVGLAGSLSAQVSGLPTRNAGVASGLALGGEVGFPDGDYGKGTAFGVRGELGSGPFGVSMLISEYDPDGPVDAYTSIGGALDWKVLGGPLIPLSITLQAGAEYGSPSGSGTIVHAPIGVGIAVKFPNPGIAIKPWLAPRVDITHFSGPTDQTKTHFGLSGGIDFSFIFGLGTWVSYDRIWADNGRKPSVLGVGADWAIHIPGL